VKIRSDARWSAQRLAMGAVLMAWALGPALSDRFSAVVEWIIGAMPGARRPGRSFTGFSDAMQRHGFLLLTLVMACVRDALCQEPPCKQNHGWRPVGADGSRVEAPRTEANLAKLGTASKTKSGPQAWLTMLIDLVSGVPIGLRVGAGNSAERTHLRHMLHLLPTAALLIADAGFVGYALWALMDKLHIHFLIRVGANVTLLRGLDVRRKDRLGEVWLWPKGMMQKGMPALRLRLIQVRDGSRVMHLVTNVMQEEQLDDATAMRFYAMRWKLELWFRGMKQTVGLKKLCSGSPRQAKLELCWNVVGLSVLGLLHYMALTEARIKADEASLAQCIRVVRKALRPKSTSSRRRIVCRTDLGRQLRLAVKDNYKRHGSKKSKDYPRVKQQQPPGNPIIIDWDESQLLHHPPFMHHGGN
jgi:hypothetical protein